MGQVINIHDKDREIDLEIGRYKIDILGGWGVDLRQFSISLEHSKSGRTVNCERSFWPVQSFAFHKRSKRILIANIMETGTYKVQFRKPETLHVKYTNLFFGGFFQDPIPNDKICIYIH